MNVFHANVKSGGGVSPSGIGYRRVIPSQYNSFRTGDTGWHTQNGTFDYSGDPTNVLYFQDLDYSYGADSWYYLLNNNAFGTKQRFTTDIGTAASDGKASFVVADFTGATNAYVIDHLTGIGYYVLDLGLFVNSWNNAIDAVITANSVSTAGFNDWFPLSIEHGESVINSEYSYIGVQNIFRYIDVIGVPYNFFWYGCTVERLSTQAYYHRSAQSVIDYGVKTGLSSSTILMARNHY